MIITISEEKSFLTHPSAKIQYDFLIFSVLPFYHTAKIQDSHSGQYLTAGSDLL